MARNAQTIKKKGKNRRRAKQNMNILRKEKKKQFSEKSLYVTGDCLNILVREFDQ